MTDEIMFDKDKFEAVLQRPINTKPMTFQDAVKKPKLKQDGTSRKPRSVQQMDRFK
jgi:hypothetical protein